MKAVITRSGGFAGLTSRREVDLSAAELAQLRSSAAGVEPDSRDAFSYEVDVDGETFTVSGASAEPLLAKLRREA